MASDVGLRVNGLTTPVESRILPVSRADAVRSWKASRQFTSSATKAISAPKPSAVRTAVTTSEVGRQFETPRPNLVCRLFPARDSPIEALFSRARSIERRSTLLGCLEHKTVGRFYIAEFV